MPLSQFLLALAIFVNAAKGKAALQLSREMGWAYPTAHSFCHKVRQALFLEQQSLRLSGVVEIDGAVFGGHLERFNVLDRKTGKVMVRARYGERRVIVVMRQRGGRTCTVVCERESGAYFAVAKHVIPGTVIHADDARAWDGLKSLFQMMRVNHAKGYSIKGACTNNAESFFSMMRRMAMGVHHRIAGKYLHLYAAEIAWRQDHRRLSNGEQWEKLLHVLLQGKTA